MLFPYVNNIRISEVRLGEREKTRRTQVRFGWRQPPCFFKNMPQKEKRKEKKKKARRKRRAKQETLRQQTRRAKPTSKATIPQQEKRRTGQQTNRRKRSSKTQNGRVRDPTEREALNHHRTTGSPSRQNRRNSRPVNPKEETGQSRHSNHLPKQKIKNKKTPFK